MLRDFRTTLIISIAIPVSIIATFNLMYFQGLTLNLMSLGGLALAWACSSTMRLLCWRISSGCGTRDSQTGKPHASARNKSARQS
jgi:hypothetical protein